MKKLAAALALILTACGGASEPVQQDTPALYNYSSIKTAMGKAQSTLDVFWEHFENPGPNEERFRVKIAKESSAYKTDFVWVEYLQQGGAPGDWRGAVGLENGGNDRFRTGDTISFSETDIVDWAYHDNGKTRGAYTTRAMLELPKDADTSSIKALYHDSPIP